MTTFPPILSVSSLERAIESDPYLKLTEIQMRLAKQKKKKKKKH